MCISQWMAVKQECPVCRARITSHLCSLVLDSYIDRMVEQLSDDLKASRKALVEERKQGKGSQTSSWGSANIEGLAQDCSSSIANVLELLQSCPKPLICFVSVNMRTNAPPGIFYHYLHWDHHYISVWNFLKTTLIHTPYMDQCLLLFNLGILKYAGLKMFFPSTDQRATAHFLHCYILHQVALLDCCAPGGKQQETLISLGELGKNDCLLWFIGLWCFRPSLVLY